GGGHHGCAVGQRTDESEDAVRFRRPVELVHHDQIGECEVPVDLRVPGAGLVELGGVHDLHQTAVDDAGVVAGEHHPHQLLRLGQAAGLDHDHVGPERGAGQAFEVGVQFAAVDGAA